MKSCELDEVERITIELPVDLLAEAREAVAAGEHTSLDKAIEQALHDWTADRTIERIGVEWLRRMCAESLAEGDPQPLNTDEIMKEIMVRAAELREARKLAS